MVPLSTQRRPRRTVRGRDFAPGTHRAPVAVTKLTREYYDVPRPPWHKWLWWGIGVALVTGLVALVNSSVFTVRNIVVNNVGSQPTEQHIREIVATVMADRPWGILPTNNLLFFSASRAKLALSNEFIVDELSFVRHWPNVLKVSFRESLIVAVWHAGDAYFLVDNHGKLVQRLTTDEAASGELVTVEEISKEERALGTEVASADVMAFVDKLGSSWQTALPNVPLLRIVLEKSSLPTVEVHTGNGWYALMSAEADLGVQLTALSRLLDEKVKDSQNNLQYIDVRFGNRIFLKPKL